MIGRRRITRTRYFQLCAALPMVGPLPLHAFMALTGPYTVDRNSILDIAIFFFMASPIGAGIPYVLFAVGALLLLRRRSEAAYRRAAVLAPILFLPILAGFFFIIGGAARQNDAIAVPELLGLALLIGYFYVAIAFAGLRMFARYGCVVGSQP